MNIGVTAKYSWCKKSLSLLLVFFSCFGAMDAEANDKLPKDAFCLFKKPVQKTYHKETAILWVLKLNNLDFYYPNGAEKPKCNIEKYRSFDEYYTLEDGFAPITFYQRFFIGSHKFGVKKQIGSRNVHRMDTETNDFKYLKDKCDFDYFDDQLTLFKMKQNGYCATKYEDSSEIYVVEVSDGSFVSALCSADELCHLNFTYKDWVITLSDFPKRHLSEWRNIRKKAIKDLAKETLLYYDSKKGCEGSLCNSMSDFLSD